MKILGSLRFRISALFRRSSIETETDEELRFHIRHRADDLERSGLSRAEAERRARLDFGGYQKFKEECREALGSHFFEALLQDIRFAIRMLGKSPGFTTVAIVTLALSIGANTAIFSFVDAVLLKPLPYPHPEQIVSLWEKQPGGNPNYISTLTFLDWKRQNRCFQSLLAVATEAVIWTGSGRPQEFSVHRVSVSYFKMLGVDAALGRTFTPDESQIGKEREVVLSNRIWQSLFGGDPKVIGRKITLDAKSYTIIGVLPAGTFDRTWAVMWLPLAFRPADMTRNYHWLYAIGRLEPGITLKQARAQMDAIGARIAALYPDSNKGWGVTVDPYIDQLVDPQLRRSLWVLLAAVGAVLLIGCANLANLMLARGSDREQEIAVRSALGASHLRLIRQLLTENVFLGILGGIASLALGDALMRGIKLWLPPGMLPPQVNVRMDCGVLIFTIVIAVLTGILFGLAPALSGARYDSAGSLKGGGRTTAGRARHRLKTALVVAEVALSFVLLAAAGVLVRSFNKLASIDPGVETGRVLAIDLPMPLSECTNGATLVNYAREVVKSVRSVPGVLDAAITDRPPMEGAGGAAFQIEGRKYLADSERPIVEFKPVGPSYFHTVGMKLLRGRGLRKTDIAGAPPVTVINETMAKTYFKGENPIGKRILIRQHAFGKRGLGPEVSWQVVGVVKDEKIGGKIWSLKVDFRAMYVTFYQNPETYSSLVVRAAMNPLVLRRSIEQAIWKVNKNQVVANIETLEQVKSESVAPDRLRTVLLAIFAGIAILLAAIGIYGVVSYSVAGRVHEMAIRLALGASPGDLLKLVIGKSMLMIVVGLTLGTGAALALTRVLASLLYDTSPTDPATFAAVAIALLGIALLACYVPARRAMNVDPMVALRHE